jgi:acetoin utilization deacetylase AcuC-like enzyme
MVMPPDQPLSAHRLPIVHHPGYSVPLPAGHRFPMNKYGLLYARILASGFGQPLDGHQPLMADEAQLCQAHHPDYVRRVLSCSLSPAEEKRIGLPVNKAVVDRARLASGGTILAARLALAHGIACQTAGGSHHAHHDFGSGYCVFNDVAVAAAVMRAEGRVRRILIIDLDVHQGDGTAAIFRDVPEITTFSIHGDKNFPVRKARSDYDLALADGIGDEDYLDLVNSHIPRLIAAHHPELIFYNAGVDPHIDDRLGRFHLSHDGIKARDCAVIDHCRGAEIPLVTVVGGGYSNDLEALAGLHFMVIEAAARKMGFPAA